MEPSTQIFEVKPPPMFAILSYILLAAIVGIGLFDLRIAWGLLAVMFAILLSLCWAFLDRNRGCDKFEELTAVPADSLTDEAADLVRQYWAFYTSPTLGIQLGGAMAAVAAAVAALAIVGAFKQFWWGLLVGAFVWFVSGHFSARVNPTSRLKDSTLKDTHEELKKLIAEHLLDRMQSQRDEEGRTSK